MCCLFGLIDYGGDLKSAERQRIIRELANASEERGADATGIAYCKSGRIIIRKDHKPAHKMPVFFPRNVKIILGHTRMTTQGSERDNRNNHPFLGHCQNTDFALAHNGMLINDCTLREENKLPLTKVRTDSYIAVQLLERAQTLNLDSLGRMAEQLVGSYNFTLLDDCGNTYIIKGNNPFALYHFKNKGYFLYASTEQIACNAMNQSGIRKIPKPELLAQGDIWQITPDGKVAAGRFTPQIEYMDPYLSLLKWDEQYFHTWQEHRPATEHLNWLIDYAKWTDYSASEVMDLWDSGCSEEDLEEIVFSGVSSAEIQLC